ILGDVLVTGVACGLAASTLTHAALGTWGAVWRADGWGWALLVLQFAVVLISHRKTFAPRSAAARTAWLLMPALLIAGIVTFNAGRAWVTAGTWGLLCIAVGSLSAVAIALAPVRRFLGWRSEERRVGEECHGDVARDIRWRYAAERRQD